MATLNAPAVEADNDAGSDTISALGGLGLSSRGGRQPETPPLKAAFLFSPFPCLQGDANKKLCYQEVLRLHWIRFIWVCIFGLMYFYCLRQSNTSKKLMSGELKESIEEFFADAGKTGERLTESEITPGFKEMIHADDVAKTLTWFQMFCMQKAGSDDHVPWAWSCDIGKVSMGPTSPVPWDIISNAEPGGESWNDSQALLEYICKPDFLSRHIAMGDDPRKVFFGKYRSFQQQIKEENKTLVNTKFDDQFDEFTVLSGNPMVTDIVETAFDKQIPPLFDKWLGSPIATADSSNQKASLLQADSADHYDSEDESDFIPSWCYNQYASIESIILQKVYEHDADGDHEVDYDEAIALARDLQIEDPVKFWKLLDVNKDQKGDVKEVLALIADGELELLGRYPPQLKGTCKNHHWGMLPVCGPQWIEVQFHIENAQMDMQSENGAYKRNAFADVVLRFKAIDHDATNPHDASTGWYHSEIELHSASLHGSTHVSELILTIGALVLFFLLFLSEFLLTLIRIPFTLVGIKAATRDPDASIQQVMGMLSRLFDGRNVRARFMSRREIVLETMVVVLFLLALCEAMHDSFERTVPQIGAYSNKQCEHVYNEELKKSFMDSRTLDDESKLISPWQYINNCLDPNMYSLLTELLREFVWDAPDWHGIAFGILQFRILIDAMYAFGPFTWLPRTLDVVASKMATFLVFYIFVVTFFALIMFICFGGAFMQFHSFQRTWYVLFLYSFGFTEPALDSVHTFEENQSGMVTTFLLCFTVLVAFIAIQIFTAIALDAYSTVHKPQQFIVAIVEEEMKLLETVASLFVPQAIIDEVEWRDRILDQSRGFAVVQLFEHEEKQPLRTSFVGLEMYAPQVVRQSAEV